MLKHLELSTPTSCLNKADDNEPIFVLRAKDPIAFMIVEEWADAAELVHGAAKQQEAYACAKQMRAWFESNVMLR